MKSIDIEQKTILKILKKITNKSDFEIIQSNNLNLDSLAIIDFVCEIEKLGIDVPEYIVTHDNFINFKEIVKSLKNMEYRE